MMEERDCNCRRRESGLVEYSLEAIRWRDRDSTFEEGPNTEANSPLEPGWLERWIESVEANNAGRSIQCAKEHSREARAMKPAEEA